MWTFEVRDSWHRTKKYVNHVSQKNEEPTELIENQLNFHLLKKGFNNQPTLSTDLINIKSVVPLNTFDIHFSESYIKLRVKWFSE